MNNQEILNRFDVLYNNITSSQAPGLDGYEKSVFWNKATLEVLKNHLNPKGNKYGEGFDNSSKRQIEFSDLVKDYQDTFDLDSTRGGYSGTAFVGHGWIDNQLSVLNERVSVITSDDRDKVVYYLNEFLNKVFDVSKPAPLIVAFINWMQQNNINNPEFVEKLREVITMIMDPTQDISQLSLVLNPRPTLDEALSDLAIKPISRIVVPINNVELDTLLSRPYKYPPKSQVWRVLVSGNPELITAPTELPIYYHARYVKIPAEVDLESNVNSDVPEVLHDEILQRAVELAKAAYVGDATQQQIIQTLGERSE